MNTNNDTSLAPHLGRLLIDRGWMFSCAESCTGGLLAAAMTETPGSSQWFDRGFITYSNAAKVEQLLVNEDTLDRFGAVSEETAMEMAAGVLTTTQLSSLAISITGIAGPGGATPGKPVGMVCFGFAQRTAQGVTTRAVTHIFGGDRAAIRRATVEFALRKAIELIEL
ncbi:CinA family protein [Pusillimonas sp. ANT_WB101]|uniref:CinA family protein n=1 Tax=Pusillimonas sp. ANT_WB101 TaxID=2597356 RepID=UPI0011EF3B84|nr:CinA family protein [Pusillimonas sp. ANT_WB101]KAA0890622.1 CinA family protein [Pusillimonas sp. ANT_WB101]NYT75428.1 CinA family protein [Alcaligenaceae bacterium]